MATTESNGKAPLATNGGFRNGAPGGGDNRLINVQPPRREDLQPAYAQTLQGESEDAGSHGWYGTMSMFLFLFTRVQLLIVLQSTPSDRVLVVSEPSPAVSSVPTHTNQSAKATLDS